MKTLRFALLLSVTVLALILPGGLVAHEGETHDDEGAGAVPIPSASTRAGSAWTELFEVVVKPMDDAFSIPSKLRIFLSEYATNAPVGGATIEVETSAEPKLVTTATASATTGIYELSLPLPREGEYDLKLIVKTPELFDLLSVRGVPVGVVAGERGGR